MRVLRLTNSDDVNPRIPTGDHAWEVCQRELSQATGEPIESLVKIIWPNDSLPEMIERWIGRDEPDLVMLLSSSFWFTYESVPVKLQRHVPVVGKTMAGVGIKAAGVSWLAENGVFRSFRSLALRSIGGETYFTPEYVIALMDRCIRSVVKHEHVGLAVRGPLSAYGGDGGASGMSRARARREAVDSTMAELCKQLRVPYVDRQAIGVAGDENESLLGDGVHADVTAHRNRGVAEAKALAEAWRQVRC